MQYSFSGEGASFSRRETAKAAVLFLKVWQCQNRDCATGTFMRDEYKVMNKNAAARQMKERQEHSEQMSFLRSL